MAIQYPGGTIVNTTFTGATKTNIVNNLETQLTTAGWSVISGTGTGDVILESASTPTSNSIRVRLRDSNLTNCACINMQNAAATKVSQNYFLLPAAAKTFRVVANKYQFFCFTPGSTAGREFVGMGVPYIPSFLSGVITGDFGWINGNGVSDSSSTNAESFRTLLSGGGNNNSYWSGLVNGTLTDDNNSVTGLSTLRLIASHSMLMGNAINVLPRWHDDSLVLSDPLLAWAPTIGTEAKIRGQMWGAMVASDSFVADTTLSSVDSHNWIGITASNSGFGTTSNTTYARGTLFVITS